MNRDQYSKAINVSDMVTERIDGELFEYSKSARCRVCNAPDEIARLVDSLLVQPFTYAMIIRLIEPLQEKLNVPQQERIVYNSLINHKTNHMPFEKIAVRLLLEEKARQRGRKVLEGADSILTADAFFTRIADKTWNLINTEEIKPTVTEGMKAMQLKYEIEEASKSDVQFEVLMTQFNLLVGLIKKHCTPEQVQTIVNEIEQVRNAGIAGQLIDEIQEAEIVEYN